ncbi:MAG: hypothetical protein AMJ46_01265 [Latescibacteria bacterium DG_63]|nr:MAG: hypothetical protein AMJ46_01265 [Latescibacteria bacterium DG_63]
MRPFRLLTYVLTTFGIAPLLAVKLFRDRRRLIGDERLWLIAAFGYGVSVLLLAPTMGLDTDRKVGFAWPAFWLAVPLLLAGRYEIDRGSKALLLTVHQAICWIPVVLHRLVEGELSALVFITILTVPLQCWAFRIYGRWRLAIPGAVACRSDGTLR